MESTRGKLLVAAPSLDDPNFKRTVILMLEHTQEGAIGVVLNRYSKFPVRRAVERWHDYAAHPKVVFVGGPVGRSSLIGVASATEHEAALWRPVREGIGTVDLGADPSSVDGLKLIRIFAGYAAWSPGQLEAELADNSWFVLRLAVADPFSASPDELWWHVFARQADASLRQLRFYPRNLSDN